MKAKKNESQSARKIVATRTRAKNPPYCKLDFDGLFELRSFMDYLDEMQRPGSGQVTACKDLINLSFRRASALLQCAGEAGDELGGQIAEPIMPAVMEVIHEEVEKIRLAADILYGICGETARRAEAEASTSSPSKAGANSR